MSQPLRQLPDPQPAAPRRPGPRHGPPVVPLRPVPAVPAGPVPAAGQAWRNTLALLMLLAAWLFTRPWEGLWHDGQLYAAQALHHLHPANFRHDLYFLFGSQDAYTLFSPLYAAAIRAFGLQAGALLLHTAGAVLWMGGAALLVSALLQGMQRWLALALLLLLPTSYDPVSLISLAEPFLTPRLFAEAFGMLTLAFVVRGQWRWSVPLLLMAFLMHPLMALGVALFCVLYAAQGPARRAVVAGMGLAGLAGLALGAAGVAPFNRLLASVDAAWLEYLKQMTPMVTWKAWDLLPYAGRLAVPFAMLCTAARLAPRVPGRVYACLALGGVLGLLASAIGTGWLDNLLLIQVQPWRALWLVQAGAALALSWLLIEYWPRGPLFRLALATFVLAVLTRNSIGGALAIAAGLALCRLARAGAPPLPQRTVRLLAGMLLALGSMWLYDIFLQADVLKPHLAAQYADLAPVRWLWAAGKLGGAALLGGSLLLLVWRLAGAANVGARLGAGALAAAALGASAWLSHTISARAQLMAPAVQAQVQASFLPLIPLHATVYWANSLRLTWFVLGRSSYGANYQLAGAPFQRATAMEGMRRLRRLHALGEREIRRAPGGLPTLAPAAPGLGALNAACADPGLDFVVLDRALGKAAIAKVSDASAGVNHFLYSCARQRAER